MFSQIIDLDQESISALNPTYRRNYIPGTENFNVLTLPKEKMAVWVSNEDTIYAIIEEGLEEEPAQKQDEDVIYYTVRSGDFLGKIANRYGCSVRDIQQWNGMYGTRLRPGQKLVLYSSQVRTPKPASKSYEVIHDKDAMYYQIQSGDTLWDIAKAWGVSVDALKQWNSNLNVKKLKPGDKIIVGKS